MTIIGKDPIYEQIEIPDFIVPILKSSEIQRLRYIDQTEFLIYPSAMHTRFEHSLGTCFLANKISERLGLNDQERKSVALAALLHDIGHAPFGHALRKNNLVTIENMEEVCLRNILANLDGLIRRAGLNSDEIFSIITGKHENSMLNEIISGQLGADRLDYLLRDAYYAGLPLN